METVIPVSEARRRFRQLLREVGRGRSYLVTRRGRPIARIVPVQVGSAGRSNARRRLLQRLRSQRTIIVDRWVRERLYDRR